MKTSDKKNLFGPILGIVILFVLFCFIVFTLSKKVGADTMNYWAVGRGMHNGLKPYVDMFETKPPGIYLIVSFILSISDSNKALLIAQAIAAAVIMLLPLIILKPKDILGIFSSLSLGVFLGIYIVAEANNFYPEMFGSLFLLTYVLLVKKEITNPIALSLPLLFSIGTKETFLFSSLGLAILMSDSLKSFWRIYVLPLLVAAGLGILSLSLLGLSESYFGIYLPYMMNVRVLQLQGGMFLLLKDLFLYYLGSNIRYRIDLLFFFLLAVNVGLAKSTSSIFRYVTATYFTLLAQAINGFYQGYVYLQFAAISVLLFLPLVRHRKLTVVLAALLLFASATFISEMWETRREDRIMKETAYVDSVLDKYNLDRYFFIGWNEGKYAQIYGTTKHSPYGPLFNQEGDWCLIPGYAEKTLQNIRKSKFIVYSSEGCPDPAFNKALADELKYFTTKPWKGIDYYNSPAYLFYFRNGFDRT